MIGETIVVTSNGDTAIKAIIGALLIVVLGVSLYYWYKASTNVKLDEKLVSYSDAALDTLKY